MRPQEARSPRYYVYVVELDKSAIRSGPKRPSAYVGSSAWPPEERLRRHKLGLLGTSRHVRRNGIRLMPEFYEAMNRPPIATREGAKRAEQAVARRLLSMGYKVYGSCVSRGNAGCFF